MPSDGEISALFRALLCTVALLIVTSGGHNLLAQESLNDQPAEVQQMVRDGRTDELESRFLGGRTPRELQLL
ncbi:MAG: hypothetical protein AB7N71_10765, partial [Phycisphaerae bacterium]